MDVALLLGTFVICLILLLLVLGLFAIVSQSKVVMPPIVGTIIWIVFGIIVLLLAYRAIVGQPMFID